MNTMIVNSNDVVGVEVENLQGEDLGEVEAIMLNKIDGQVSYVVLTSGGFLGMGNKLFALPWSIFSYNPEREKFTINIDKERLKNSPGFDKDHWPDMNSATWGKEIREYYR